MINKCAIQIANLLITASDEYVSNEQLEKYIYGLECFINTFISVILLILGGILSNTIELTLLWLVSFSLLRHFAGGAHTPTQVTCIISSVFLGYLNNWAIIYIKQSFLLYMIFILIFLLFTPVCNKKITLSSKKHKVYKFISCTIILVGLFLYYKLGNTAFTSTLCFSYMCVSFLIIIAQFQLLKGLSH